MGIQPAMQSLLLRFPWYAAHSWRMKNVLMCLSFAALTACGAISPSPSVPVAPPLPDAANDSCGAIQYGALIGQDATALERVLILGQVRVIRPGTAVSMDFRPERINFAIGSGNRIMRIYCG